MTSLFETPVQRAPVVLRPYQVEAVEAVERARAEGYRRVLITLFTGAGKCLGRGTPVLMFDGRVVPVEDVRVGDLLMGPDSRPRRVASVCQGREPLYRVVPVKGEPFVVNRSHILSFKRTGKHPKRLYGWGPGEVVNASVCEALAMSPGQRHVLKLWRTGVDFPQSGEPMTVPPYLLGLWLGDGHSDGPRFTTPDPEVLECIAEYADQHGLYLRHVAIEGKADTWAVSCGKPKGKNPLLIGLRSLGVLGDKHVPERYLTASRDDRLQLLAGVVDTDGYYTQGCYDLVFKQRRLAEGVVFLARSLGLAAYLAPCRKTCTNTGATGDYYRVSVSGAVESIPVRVPRRKPPEGRAPNKDVLLTGWTLEEIGPGEYFGFELDGPDRLFLLGDFTVTHNTTVFSELARLERERGGRTVVMAHRDELIRQAVDRLRYQAGLDAYAEVADERAPRSAQVVVASVASVGRKGSVRLDWFRPSLVVVDEAHHAPADSYGEALKRFGCFDPGGAFCLGVTATPHRMDNKPLHGTNQATFEIEAYRYGVVDGIRGGWLSDVRAYRAVAGYSLDGVRKVGGDFNQGQLAELVDTDGQNLEALKHWEEVAAGRRTIVFCSSVSHSRRMAALFASRGHAAESVDGSMDGEERAAIIGRFRSGETQILTNCNIATEGFDVPGIECVLMLRPTMSWSLYAQMVGRGLRLAEGKQDCVVIDVVGVTEGKSLASVPDMFGLPRGYQGQGESIAQVVAALGEVPEFVRARLAQRKFDMNSLPGVLAEVDLLSELTPPEEVRRVSRLAWMPVGEGVWALSAGSARDGSETKRTARLMCDASGLWRVATESAEHGIKGAIVGHVDEAAAFRRADAEVERRWPGIAALLAHDAKWRGRRQKSDKQMYWLKRFGLSDDEIDAMDAGQVSAFLDRKFSERGKR